MMKFRRFLLPLAVSLAATPILLFLGLASAGAGHGDYILAKILFPYTLLSTRVSGSITALFLGVAVVQFPLYGMMLGGANVKGGFQRTLVLIGLIHALAVVACFALVSEQFA